jgi:hypothetical protein
MLDTYQLFSSTKEYIPYTKNVIEQRAPTDDSIRLYKELLEKASNSILDSFKINTTYLDIDAVVVRSWETRGREVRYKININNKALYGSIPISFIEEDRVKIANIIVEGLSKSISIELSKMLSNEVIKDIFFN